MPEQIEWLEKELKRLGEDWKIPYFHHPLVLVGRAARIARRSARRCWSRCSSKHDVSVVFTGHDHFYERIKPQKGIPHFVVGSGGKLRRGDIDRRSGLTAGGFDTDLAFLAAEIDGDELLLQRDLRARARSSTPVSSSAGSRNSPVAAALFLHASPAGSPLQSDSKTACNLPGDRAGSVTITPTSRRPSSSSLRRLWLPTKTAVPSRTIARTCRRWPASLPRLDARQALLHLADDPDLDAGLARAPRARAASAVVGDLERRRSAAASSPR